MHDSERLTNEPTCELCTSASDRNCKKYLQITSKTTYKTLGKNMTSSRCTRMPTWSLIVLLLIVESTQPTGASVINRTGAEPRSSKLDFMTAKCRQRCFLKTMDHFDFRNGINSDESFEVCHQNPNCFMCYDYCRVLIVAERDLATSMCSDRIFCSKGCRTACNFHRIKSVDTFIYELINSS